MFQKKSVIFASLIIGVVMLGGFGCNQKPVQPEGEQGGTVVGEDNSQAPTVKAEDDSDGMLSGLQGLLTGGASLKCVSTDEGDTWVTYTNGKSFRGEGMEDGKKQQVLFIDKTMYTWDDATKQGMKLDQKCLEDFQKDIGIEGNVPEPEDNFNFSIESLEAEEGAGKINCKPSTEADFTVPRDVTFVDQCALMKEQMKGFAMPMQDVQH